MSYYEYFSTCLGRWRIFNEIVNPNFERILYTIEGVKNLVSLERESF